MSREILFRGKVKLPNSYRGYNLSHRNGDWVYGLMDSNGSIRRIFVDTNTIRHGEARLFDHVFSIELKLVKPTDSGK